MSRTGVHQGCPLGPAAFAVGIHSVVKRLESFSLQWGVFYLDDGLLVGPLSRVELAFNALCEGFAQLGLEVNKTKCALWGPETIDPTALGSDNPLKKVSQTNFCEGSG